MSRVVLVTGVSRDLAARCARTLAQDPDVTVVGVDVTPPRFDLGRVSYVRADIRNPMIAKVIAGRAVDTVVHMAIVASPGRSGSRSSMKEINVIGTMQLLAACQKANSFARLVVQSSVSVYGSSSRDPAEFTEDMSPRLTPRTGLGKDSVEIESYVRGLARRRPDVGVTTLRLAALMGAGVDSSVTRYLALPVVPKVAGFDARLQFLHPSDAVAAIQLVALGDLTGTYNVAASDIVTLSQAIAIMGRPRVPVPAQLAPLLAGASRQLHGVDLSSDQIDALTYGRAMDTSRFGRASGFRPLISSRQALREYAAVARPGLLSAERVDSAVDRLGRSLAGSAAAGKRETDRG
ncbi:MAG: NAD-dependent epimerase/dehydratase family protein [Propionibacteriaceae bacterium]